MLKVDSAEEAFAEALVNQNSVANWLGNKNGERASEDTVLLGQEQDDTSLLIDNINDDNSSRE